MAASEKSLGDLSAREGISDYTIELAGLDNVGLGAVTVRFNVVRMNDELSFPQATLSFTVGPENDGLEGAVGRAYDKLILALRQMLYHAAVGRAEYGEKPSRLNPSD